jgi:DNA adenine methylase
VIAPTRPVIRYHGGKWRLAPWIISHMPPHRVYVEPFAGAASVLMRKSRSYAEVITDLDGEIVSLFRVLRDASQSRELARMLSLTPYARAEYEIAYMPDGDPIEMARRTIIRAYMGFGSAAATGNRITRRSQGYVPSTGFRANSNRSGTIPAHDWANFPPQIVAFCERLRGVVIENRAAQEVIPQHDSPRTLYYCDPPYPQRTRDSGSDYMHEMTDEDHRELAALLRGVDGMVMLSGYGCDLYDIELYQDWHRMELASRADGALKRTEVLWFNDAAWGGKAQETLTL